MGWREYLHLYEKYEGDIGLATERELEHAGRGMNPELARRIAGVVYKQKVRKRNNEQNKQQNQEAGGGDRCFADSLF